MVFANTYTGELPLEIIRMKANGVFVGLDGNMGFTLPSNIGELGDDITKLYLSNCSLTGPRSTRSERFRFRVDMVAFFAGQLPKELGKPVNLRVFNVYGNQIEGQLGIRSERVVVC